MKIQEYNIQKIYTELNAIRECENIKTITSSNPIFIDDIDNSFQLGEYIYPNYDLNTKSMGIIASKQLEFLVKYHYDTIDVLYEFRFEFNALTTLIIKKFLKYCIDKKIKSLNSIYISNKDIKIHKNTGRKGVIFDILDKLYQRVCIIKQKPIYHKQKITLSKNFNLSLQ